MLKPEGFCSRVARLKIDKHHQNNNVFYSQYRFFFQLWAILRTSFCFVSLKKSEYRIPLFNKYHKFFGSTALCLLLEHNKDQ